MTTMTPTWRDADTVGGLLATVHEGWMKEVATFLAPALNEAADFWTRWAVARFLGDQFGDRFRSECALVDALGPLLPEEAARTLATARAAVEDTAEELMAAGRRRATRLRTARLARRLIDQLALWCVEVELATSRIRTGQLPPEASRLLASLHVVNAHWQ